MEKTDFTAARHNDPLPDPRDISVECIIKDLWQAYVDSTSSFLTDLEGAALALEAEKDPVEDAANIRRILHSIKGESGMCGVMDVYSLIHEAEFAFEELDPDQATDMIFKVKDWIEAAMQYASAKDMTSVKQWGIGGAERRQGFGDRRLEDSSRPDNLPDRRSSTIDRRIQRTENSKIKTLVAEDNAVSCKRLDMMLNHYCNPTFAPDGIQALDLFKMALDRGTPYELVTLDIQMPEMDGLQTLEAIRKLEAQRGILGLDGVKIIMITSQEESENIFGSFRRGCEAYVIKDTLDYKLHEEMAKLGLLKAQTIYSL